MENLGLDLSKQSQTIGDLDTLQIEVMPRPVATVGKRTDFDLLKKLEITPKFPKNNWKRISQKFEVV